MLPSNVPSANTERDSIRFACMGARSGVGSSRNVCAKKEDFLAEREVDVGAGFKRAQSIKHFDVADRRESWMYGDAFAFAVFATEACFLSETAEL